MVMKTIGAAKFKEQCLALLEGLDDEGITITKHGKPVAHLIPHAQESASLIGSLKGKIVITGDLMSTGESWHAQS
jgi:prevent-host-death family protein